MSCKIFYRLFILISFRAYARGEAISHGFALSFIFFLREKGKTFCIFSQKGVYCSRFLNMNKDLTVGSPSKVLIKFCLPLFGSMVFQQLYNLADSLVAGQYIGEHALAAVGNGYEITLVFLAFAFGFNIGCSVIVSRLFGAKNYRDMKTAVYTTYLFTVFLCALLMVLGFVFCKPLLRVINTPEHLIEDSALYLRVYVAGLPFVFFYNISTGIFSALGDSLTPFIFLAASSLSNIAMDILFVSVFKMGIAGVAWATFICQGVSCILAVLFVFLRLKKIKTEKVKIFSWKLLGQISVIAIPSVLQQSFISVGNIIIQSVINAFGQSVIAGYSAAIKLNSFVVSSLFTLGNGISNFSSQNLGANKTERISKGFRAGLLLVLIFAVFFALLYVFVGKYLLLAFLKPDATDALKVGTRFLQIVAPAYLIVAAKIAADSIMRGTGKMIRFAISTFLDLLLRVVLAIVLSKTLQTDGIWLSWPIGWFVAAVLSIVFAVSILLKYKKIRLQEKEREDIPPAISQN